METPEEVEVAVTTDDGRLQQLLVNPRTEFAYENAESITHFRFHLTVNGETVSDQTYQNHDSVVIYQDRPTDRPGIEEYAPESATVYIEAMQVGGGYNVIDDQSPFTPSDFEVSEDGASETFDLEIAMEVSAIAGELGTRAGGDDPEVVVSASASRLLKLTIHNEAESSTGGGSGEEESGSEPEPTASTTMSDFTVHAQKTDGEWEPEEPSI